MAKTIIVYPKGNTNNTNPHVLFSGGTGSTYTIEMTTTGELLFSQDIALSIQEVITQPIDRYIGTLEYVDYDDVMYMQYQPGGPISTTNTYIAGFSGDSTSIFNTNYYSGLTVYRVDTVFDSSGSIMFITGDNDTVAGIPEVIRRVDLSTGQVTHEFTVASGGHIQSRLLLYEYNNTEYLAFSEISGSSYTTACITIMNPSNLSIIGRYGYVPTTNISVNYINDLQYDGVNGKLYWTMPAGGYTNDNDGTVFGDFDLSTTTVSTGSTINFAFYSQNQILDGSTKIYTAGIYYQNAANNVSGLTYGYYDHSTGNYTQLYWKGIDYSQGSAADVDVYLNAHSDKDKDTGDIYQVVQYDLLTVDGATGEIVETVDLIYSGDYYGVPGRTPNYTGARAPVSAMGYNERQNRIWTARYNGGHTTNIVLYG